MSPEPIDAFWPIVNSYQGMWPLVLIILGTVAVFGVPLAILRGIMSKPKAR